MQGKGGGGTGAGGNAPCFVPSHVQGDGWKHWEHIYGTIPNQGWISTTSCSGTALNSPCQNNRDESASQGVAGCENRRGCDLPNDHSVAFV